jgi:hypothetical protein
MRCFPRLGAVNTALISLYFAPVWGCDAYRVLTSPYYGFEERAQAVAASYFRAVFDLGLDGLLRVSSLLAGAKFVVAIAFVAYLIDFARALVVGREPDRMTLDAALIFAAVALMLWAWPALVTADAGLIRLCATELMLLTGAMAVIAVERHIDDSARVVDAAGAQRTGSATQQTAAA